MTYDDRRINTLHSTEKLSEDNHSFLSHRVFEWAALALFLWFGFTGLLLWRPGYYAYSLLTGGVLLLWTFFLFDDIGRGINRVQGNAVYWIFLGLGVILGGHLLADQYLPQVESSYLFGSVNISMCYHLGLISVAILLAQRIGDIKSIGKIFPDALAVLLGLVGGVTATFLPDGPGRDSLWLIGACGVCIWLTPFVRAFSKNQGSNFSFADRPSHEKVKLILRLFAACCVAVLLLATMNLFCLYVLAGCIVVVSVLVAVARIGKPVFCWIAAGLGGAAVLGILFACGQMQFLGVLGMGEKGFSHVYGGSSGVSILLATTGWAGLLVVVLGGFVIASLGLLRVKQNMPGQLIPAGIWVLATFIASAGFLSPGGYVSLASVIALAVTWGLWSKMVISQPAKTRSPWGLLIAVLSFLGLATIVSNPGLLSAMGATCGLADKGQHFLAGFLITIIVAWVLGKRYWWLGLLGVVLAILLGGLAEIVQKEFSLVRAMQMTDWKAHIRGGLVAGAIFAVALTYRHVIRMTQRGGRKRKRTGRILVVIVRSFVLLCVLAFAAWWSKNVCKTIDHRLKNPTPVFTVTDVLMTPTEDKPLFVPGCTNDNAAVMAYSIMTSLPGRNNPEIGWQSGHKGFLRVLPRLMNVPQGIIKPWFQGLPFGPLSYSREKGVLDCIPIGRDIFAIDARDVERWRKSDLGTLNELVEKNSQDKAVVFIHPGPVEDFKGAREVIQQTYPEIPCVCDVTFESGDKLTVVFLVRSIARKEKPLPQIRILSSDIQLAKMVRRYFRNKCHADVVSKNSPKAATSKPGNAKKNWLNFYPNLETVVGQ